MPTNRAKALEVKLSLTYIEDIKIDIVWDWMYSKAVMFACKDNTVLYAREQTKRILITNARLHISIAEHT